MDLVKNAPIWLKFGVSNSIGELISHTKYEQNRSIFDNVQNFGPNYFDIVGKLNSKFLICYYKMANLPKKRSKIKGQVGALGPVFDRAHFFKCSLCGCVWA